MRKETSTRNYFGPHVTLAHMLDFAPDFRLYSPHFIITNYENNHRNSSDSNNEEQV